MSTNVTMPSMGFDMTEGKVSRWIKNVGDAVERGQVIGEIETEKATVDLEAPVAGTLTQILVEAGNTVAVNTPIAVIGEAGSAPAAEPAASAAQAEAAKAKAPEAAAEQSQAQAPASTVPDSKKVEAPASKSKAKTAAATAAPPSSDKQKESAPPSATETPTQETGAPATAEKPSASAPADESNGRIKASPVARNMAKSEGIDLSAIQGTGPGGRIIERDVLAAIQARGDKPTAPAAPASKPAPTQAPAAAPAAAPAELTAGEQPLSKMRQVIARRLVESKTTIPHFYLTMEIMMGEAMKLREQLNAMVTDDAEKLSVNDLIVAAAARTLRKYPYVNGYFKGDKLELHDSINVGIAVSVDDGLMTPVLHDVDQKSLKQIAVQAKEAAARARANKLKPDDLGPGTFTVSNLGMFGIKEFAAIINPPESSILAVGAVQKVPVVQDDEIKIAQVMQVTLSCDHRIVDGALGARFLQDLKRLLENPVNLLV